MKLSAIVYGLILTLASCGEVYDLNGFDWEPDLPPSDSVFNREIQILDFGSGNLKEGHRPLGLEDPMYFSLEKISSVHLGYKSTARWDVSFSGMYRSEISCNNKASQLPYSGTGEGGILVIDEPYSEVINIPDDTKFKHPGRVGISGFESQFWPGGYAFYTFFDNIFRPDKISNLYHSDPLIASDANRYLHMVYCLSEDFAKAFPSSYGEAKYKPVPVTILIRTAAGNYAKLEMQSFYKSTLNPLEMRRGSDKPIPYFSFKYMVVKKAEKRFGFVARKSPLKINMSTGQRIVSND